MKTALKTSHLRKEYGAFTLEDLDLTLPGGTIMGLIGENGAGKSTAIKCILGAVHPTSGTVDILEKGSETRGVGYVPDECPFTDSLTVKQVSRFLPGMYPDWDSALFDRYLTQYGLDKGKKVKELSRGMKMKLTIAAALAHRPKLLILDEATSGLDPVVREEILEEFLNFVSDEEHAILISSHITSDLEKICDYVTYLHKGRVTVAGEKDALLDTYARVACTKAELEAIAPEYLVGSRVSRYGCEALVSDREAVRRKHPNLVLEKPTLEDLMIFTMRGEKV